MTKTYLFTQKGCINCPAYKQALTEAKIDFIEIDITKKKFEDMQFDLLENNIFFMSTPTIVVQSDSGEMKKVELEDII